MTTILTNIVFAMPDKVLINFAVIFYNPVFLLQLYVEAETLFVDGLINLAGNRVVS